MKSYCIALSENTPGALARWICLADAVQRRGTCIARLPGRLCWCRYLGDWVVQVVLEDVIHRLILRHHYSFKKVACGRGLNLKTSHEWFENSLSGFWWAIAPTQDCFELQVLRNIYLPYLWHFPTLLKSSKVSVLGCKVLPCQRPRSNSNAVSMQGGSWERGGGNFHPIVGATHPVIWVTHHESKNFQRWLIMSSIPVYSCSMSGCSIIITDWEMPCRPHSPSHVGHTPHELKLSMMDPLTKYIQRQSHSCFIEKYKMRAYQ